MWALSEGESPGMSAVIISYDNGLQIAAFVCVSPLQEAVSMLDWPYDIAVPLSAAGVAQFECGRS